MKGDLSVDQETILTRKRYNRTSLFYDWMDRMINSDIRRELLGDVTGKVLEVGVGTGKNLEFYPTECEITGIDISPGMLKKAKLRARDTKAQVELKEMDAQYLRFEDNCFDTVVATCVFCSVPDPIKGLQEIRRVCKSGGKIILLEHVRSDHKMLGTLMDLIDPLTVKMMGPHINRRTVENVKAAGLHINDVIDQKPKILKLILATP
ncbi:Phosphatidylethanolamine N-methyltransferase [Desulfosporosinus metallidurans]|uniref:Phosphatidylethanolamine N-methyltransferase n=1 Tax=Desulfosporosinus metallidurans TaxID=1888891 RepID=A0A1Q8QNC3_9FIRM|nr:Phosphatidylethanolamine N-methyltransferase [Desulfosporosinus metallidurans]